MTVGTLSPKRLKAVKQREIKNMAAKLKWTKQQDDLIRKHYKYNIEHLFTLKLFSCRTKMAITVRANRLGLHRRPWMDDEDDVIIKHYTEYGPVYCMQHLPGRTEIAICSRALKLNVKRDLKKRRNKIPDYNVEEMNKLMFNKPWGKK